MWLGLDKSDGAEVLQIATLGGARTILGQRSVFAFLIRVTDQGHGFQPG